MLTIYKIPHYPWIAGESDCRNESKGKLKTHETVEKVVHAGHVLNVLVEGHQESREDGDGSGQEHSLPAFPLQVLKIKRQYSGDLNNKHLVS